MTIELASKMNIDLPDERGAHHMGGCFIRLAGIIENAVAIEVLEIERRHVRLRVRIGDDDPKEYRLNVGSTITADLAVKSATVGR